MIPQKELTREESTLSKGKKYPLIRLAHNADIKDILELWGNHACIKQINDSVRWNWANKASLIWEKYAEDIIKNPYYFLQICDYDDNGLSAFLIAKFEELPPYYESKCDVKIEEFYLRPKERSPELFQDMISGLIQEVRLRFELLSEEKLTLKIESLPQDQDLLDKLFQGKARKSSVIQTIKMN